MSLACLARDRRRTSRHFDRQHCQSPLQLASARSLPSLAHELGPGIADASSSTPRVTRRATLPTCAHPGTRTEDSNGRQSHRHRPRHHELRRRGHGRRRPGRHPERRRRTDHAVGRRLHEGRRAARRPGRQATGGHQPAEHRLLDQALHGPQDDRGAGRDQARPLQGRRRPERRRRGRGPGQALHAARDLGDDPPEDEADRRGLPRPHGRRRRSSPCPRTSTTRSARPRRTPARSPASTCSASSTSRRPPRSPTASTRRRTRRSPSSTSAAARTTSPSSSSTTSRARASSR